MNDPTRHSHISRILTNPNVLQNPTSFFEVYEIPIRKFFTCLCRNANDADEQFQEFAVKFLSGAFAGFKSDKGRFRDYLKTSLRNQVRRSFKQGANSAISMPENLDAVDPQAVQPIDEAMKEFDSIEGEQIKRLVEDDLLDEERQNKHQAHSLLQFAIGYQRQRVQEFAKSGGRSKIPVAAIVDFIQERFGETVSSDTAKQRMFRARTMYASKMIDEIGVRLGDSATGAVREAAEELGLAVYIGSELNRRERKIAGK